MKQAISFRSLLREAFTITWRQKGWWFLGFLAFFLSGSMSYQLVTQAIGSLSQPEQWLSRWQFLSTTAAPMTLLRGQWNILLTDPRGWFALVGVWLIIFFALLVFLFVAVFAFTTIVGGLKVREEEGQLLLAPAIREALIHVKTVFGIALLVQVVSNILLAVLSAPVVALTVYPQGLVGYLALVVLFLLAIVAFVVIGVCTMYAIIAAVFHDLNVRESLSYAWRVWSRSWVQSCGMLIAQLLLTVVLALAIGLIASFIVIPVTIVGYLLIANQQYDITALLPNLIFLLLGLGFLILGAAYTVFQIAAWTLLFLEVQEREVSLRLAVTEIDL